jgi:hypothetical protein
MANLRVICRCLLQFPLKPGNKMKYLVPPIVIPALLLIGVVAYGMLRPLIIVVHLPVPAALSQPR